MTEKRMIMREIVTACPDGNSVRSHELIEVEIVSDDELGEPGCFGYSVVGEWRIMRRPRTMAEEGPTP